MNGIENSYNIHVCVRFRPPVQPAATAKYGSNLYTQAGYEHQQQQLPWPWAIDCVNHTVQSRDPLVTSQPPRWFCFERVFGPNSKTAHIYGSLVRPVVFAAVRDGVNGTVLAYGETNSGKTHTITGTMEDKGLVPYVVEDLFTEINNNPRNDRSVQLSVSYIEIYNERVSDLLARIRPIKANAMLSPNTTAVALSQSSTYLNMMGGGGGGGGGGAESSGESVGAIIPKLSRYPVSSVKEVLDLKAKGDAFRHVGRNNEHVHASRSHVLLRIHIQRIDLGNDGVGSSSKAGRAPSMVTSHLDIVDLAGSETTYNPFHNRMMYGPYDPMDRAELRTIGGPSPRLINAKTDLQKRRQEGQNIRRSLLSLIRVIQALVERQQQLALNQPELPQIHIPYRDSKLTRLLSDGLGGNSNAVIVCTASPTEGKETAATLHFASVAQGVRIDPKPAVAQPVPVDQEPRLLNLYQNQLQKLRDDLQREQMARQALLEQQQLRAATGSPIADAPHPEQTAAVAPSSSPALSSQDHPVIIHRVGRSNQLEPVVTVQTATATTNGKPRKHASSATGATSTQARMRSISANSSSSDRRRDVAAASSDPPAASAARSRIGFQSATSASRAKCRPPALPPLCPPLQQQNQQPQRRKPSEARSRSVPLSSAAPTSSIPDGSFWSDQPNPSCMMMAMKKVPAGRGVGTMPVLEAGEEPTWFADGSGNLPTEGVVQQDLHDTYYLYRQQQQEQMVRLNEHYQRQIKKMQRANVDLSKAVSELQQHLSLTSDNLAQAMKTIHEQQQQINELTEKLRVADGKSLDAVIQADRRDVDSRLTIEELRGALNRQQEQHEQASRALASAADQWKTQYELVCQERDAMIMRHTQLMDNQHQRQQQPQSAPYASRGFAPNLTSESSPQPPLMDASSDAAAFCYLSPDLADERQEFRDDDHQMMRVVMNNNSNNTVTTTVSSPSLVDPPRFEPVQQPVLHHRGQSGAYAATAARAPRAQSGVGHHQHHHNAMVMAANSSASPESIFASTSSASSCVSSTWGTASPPLPVVQQQSSGPPPAPPPSPSASYSPSPPSPPPPPGLGQADSVLSTLSAVPDPLPARIMYC